MVPLGIWPKGIQSPDSTRQDIPARLLGAHRACLRQIQHPAASQSAHHRCLSGPAHNLSDDACLIGSPNRLELARSAAMGTDRVGMGVSPVRSSVARRAADQERLHQFSAHGRWLRLRRVEIHLRDLARCFRCLEICRIWLEPRARGKQAGRELLHVRVVILQGVVVALAFDRDSVFSASEFILQAQEIFT